MSRPHMFAVLVSRPLGPIEPGTLVVVEVPPNCVMVTPAGLGAPTARELARSWWELGRLGVSFDEAWERSEAWKESE